MGDIKLSNVQNVLLYSLCVIVWCRENGTLWHIRTANAAQSILILSFSRKSRKWGVKPFDQKMQLRRLNLAFEI